MKTKQTGSALIVSLLILLVMTMIGISAMNTSTMEEKMAANDRNQKIIFQRTEEALRAAEDDVVSKNTPTINNFFDTNEPGYYTASDNVDYSNQATWNQGTTCIALPNNSCYIVEKVPNSESSNSTQPNIMAQSYGQPQSISNQVLRITARSTDANNITTALLQSHLRK